MSKHGTYLRRPGSHAPRGRVVINKDSPHSVGLVGAWPMFMDGRLDIIEDVGPNKMHAFWTNPSSMVPSPLGGYMANIASTATNTYAYVPYSSLLSFPGDQVSMLIRIGARSDADTVFAIPHATPHASPFSRVGLYVGAYALQLRINSTVVNASVNMSLTEIQTGLGVYDGSNMYIDIEGVNRGSTAKTGAIDNPNSQNLLFFRNSSGNEDFTGDALDFRLWDRALTPNERVEVWHPATRWDMYYELGLIVYSFPAPASTDTTVTPAGPAAITLTGYAPTPTVSASVAPGVGAISLTGYAPGLMISPQPGTAQIALTGLPPVPEVAATVAPGVGALALTGYAPGLKLGVEPGTGAIIVTGYPPTVPDGDAPVDGPNLQGYLANVGSMMDR